LSIFGRVLGGGGSSGNDGPDPASYSPDKAHKFFEHARTAHDTANFEYAIQHWCNGMRQDPRLLEGLEGLFTSMSKFLETPLGKKGPSKDTYRAIAGKADVDRYVAAVLEWSASPADLSLALRAAELAGKCLAGDAGIKVCDSAAKLTNAPANKPKKENYLRLSDAYAKLNKPDKSVNAAEQALKVDPTDGELAAKIRSLAAAATMQRGGYDTAGTEGGFRNMIKDVDKQRQLIDQESIVKTDETLDSLIKNCEDDYAKRPTDQFAVEKLASRLLERGKPADEKRAHDILMKGFDDTHQVRFRLRAGELVIKEQKRKLADLRKMLDQAPDDPLVKSMFETEGRLCVEKEIEEYKLRLKAYPTDVGPKYELARLYFGIENYEEAIALLQEIRNDPKHRAQILNMLGLSFLRIGFLPESVETFRQAREFRDANAEMQLEIDYNLMIALRKLSENDGDLPSAEEAYKISSSIAIKLINYRDIRQQREAIGKLVQSLKTK